MDYLKYDFDQLIERINELEVLNKQLLNEKEQETRLDFAWVGNLGNWYWNRKTNTVTCNDLKITTLGYMMDEIPKKLTHQFFTDKLHPDDYEKTMQAMTLHLQGKASVYEIEYRIQAKDKSWKWFYDRGTITLRDHEGKPELLSGIVFDITARKEEELALKKDNESIYIDELTRSTNKRTFKEKAAKLISEKSCNYAFIVLDVDNFKLINDIFSYEGGDCLLKHIANTLFQHIKENEVFGRIVGDKFYLLLSYLSENELESRMKKITKDILVFKFDRNPSVNIVVSSGIYVIKDRTISIDTISDRASLAAKMIKGSYTSDCFFYNDAIRIRIVNDNEIENEMHGALKNVVKIDHEFFNEIASTIRGKKIVKSIVKTAKDLAIETVAEGVETKAQVEFLRKIGCDMVQGFYYAKPMPISDFVALLDQEA